MITPKREYVCLFDPNDQGYKVQEKLVRCKDCKFSRLIFGSTYNVHCYFRDAPTPIIKSINGYCDEGRPKE